MPSCHWFRIAAPSAANTMSRLTSNSKWRNLGNDAWIVA